MAKMLFDLPRGVIEVEGEVEFVEKVYSDLRSALLDKVATISAGAPTSENSAETASVVEEAKKLRKRTKSSGPSCASRIEGLKADGFFDQLRISKEVTDKLREKGTAYAGKNVAAALTNMTAAGKLRRVKESGVWKYQKP